MKDYILKLQLLESECKNNYKLSESMDSEVHDKAYKKIREDSLKLLESAQRELSGDNLVTIKKLVIDFLCHNCGCHLDLEVLTYFTPNVLTEDDLEYIKHNSPLARWF